MSQAAPAVTEELIRESLRGVIDPELRQPIVELGMVRSIEIKDAGVVDIVISLTTPACPVRSHFEQAVAEGASSVEGVEVVNVGFDVLSDSEKEQLRTKLGRGTLPQGAVAQVRNVICVGSGKGGVGKSTMTVNLAAALALEGKKVAIVDCDVYGYSIPRMLDVQDRPRVNDQRKLLPVDAAGGLKVMSIGFFVEGDEAVIWRGARLHRAIQQFLEDVEWGDLDYLLLDLPPGTGDVSMTLAQLLPQSRFVIVTTPQPAAQQVARRSADMSKKVNIEVVGVIENMSGMVTPSGERLAIFGEGGGQELADELDVPLLAKVPLDQALREQSDAGQPLVVVDPDGPAAQAIRTAARGLIALAPPEDPLRQAAAQPLGMELPMAPAGVAGGS